MLQINASIAQHKNRIWCVYRTRNLYQFDAGCFLTELDTEFNSITDRRLIAENQNTAFEDVRLFSFGDDLLAFYTFMPVNEIGSWDWEYIVGFAQVDVKTSILKNHISLRSLSRRFNEKNLSNEKNWSPYIYRDELYMVTDFDPFLRIIKIGTGGEKVMLESFYLSKAKTLSWQFGELRGGTPLLADPAETNGTFYGFVHSYRINDKGFKRYYYYTVVKFDHLKRIFDYYPQPLEPPNEEIDEDYKLRWTYSNNAQLKVIFPIGIMLYDDGVLVSFGRDDVCSYIEFFSWTTIKSYFSPIQ